MAIREWITFNVNGREFSTLPDFAVIDLIEQRESLGNISDRLERGDIRVRDAAILCHAAAKRGGSTISYMEMGEECMKQIQQDGTQMARSMIQLVNGIFGEGPAEGKGTEAHGKGEPAESQESEKAQT